VLTGDTEDHHWHLDKRVPIGMIVTLLVQFALGLWFISKLDARVYALEVAQVTQRERDINQDADNNRAFSLLRDDLREVSRKLDRLFENGFNGPNGKK
jgi:hypothetical protein